MILIHVTLLLPKIANDWQSGTVRRTVSINPSQIITVSEPGLLQAQKLPEVGCYIGTVLGEWAVEESREPVLEQMNPVRREVFGKS